MLLEVKNMSHYFGGLRAVNGFNLRIEPSQIHGLIGPKIKCKKKQTKRFWQ